MARLGGCAQDGQNCRHGPTDLLGGDRTRGAFPRQAHRSHQRTGHHQLVMHGSYQQGPALKLLGRAQAGPVPEQALLVKAITMLLAVASFVKRADQSQGSRSLTNPEKPTHARVARTLGRPKAGDANDRPLDVAGLLEMQLLPGLDQELMPFLVLALPHAIRGTMCLGRVALEAWPILAGCPPLAGPGR